MSLSGEFAHNGVSKIERYGWSLQDEPGTLQYIAKHQLKVDENYQREGTQKKILTLASDWSWLACGALIVARRVDGNQVSYWVVDGGHRREAAMRRADIDKLPCLVFDSTGVPDEARAFLAANTNRRAMYVIEKFKALRQIGDRDALLIDDLIKKSGRTPSSGSGPSTVGCLSQMLRAARESRGALLSVWPVIVDAAIGRAIVDKLVQGLVYLESRMPEGESLADPRWRKRVIAVGSDGLVDAAASAASYHARGGGRVYAEGMLKAINAGLHKKLMVPGINA